MRPTVTIRPYRVGDLGWAIDRHAQLYADEYGWNEEFEALVAKLFAKFPTQHNSALEQFWVAEVDGERAGCVLLRALKKTSMQRNCVAFWSTPRRVVSGWGENSSMNASGFPRPLANRRIILWNNDILVSARRIYAAAGFTLIETSPHRSFGRDLVGQFWVRDL